MLNGFSKKRGLIKKSFICEFHSETVSNVNLGFWNILFSCKLMVVCHVSTNDCLMTAFYVFSYIYLAIDHQVRKKCRNAVV